MRARSANCGTRSQAEQPECAASCSWHRAGPWHAWRGERDWAKPPVSASGKETGKLLMSSAGNQGQFQDPGRVATHLRVSAAFPAGPRSWGHGGRDESVRGAPSPPRGPGSGAPVGRGGAATSRHGTELRLRQALRPERGEGCRDPARAGRCRGPAGKAAPAASGRAGTTCQERDSNPASFSLTPAWCVP
ncbi:unnamed protein product [Coccothraustes coccothraustes]